VAETLGDKLVDIGYDVVLGTRDPKKLDEKKKLTGTLGEWLIKVEHNAKVVTFQEAAAHSELLINATHGQVSVEALRQAVADKVGSKALMDNANELSFSEGLLACARLFLPPRTVVLLRISNGVPNLKVVKTLNLITAKVMVKPASGQGRRSHGFSRGKRPGREDQSCRTLEILRLIRRSRLGRYFIGPWLEYGVRFRTACSTSRWSNPVSLKRAH